MGQAALEVDLHVYEHGLQSTPKKPTLRLSITKVNVMQSDKISRSLFFSFRRKLTVRCVKVRLDLGVNFFSFCSRSCLSNIPNKRACSNRAVMRWTLLVVFWDQPLPARWKKTRQSYVQFLWYTRNCNYTSKNDPKGKLLTDSLYWLIW